GRAAGRDSLNSGPGDGHLVPRTFSLHPLGTLHLEMSSDSAFAFLPLADARPDGDDAPIARDTRDAHPISLVMKLTNLFAIVVPFAGMIAAVILLWGWGFYWTHFF